LGAGGGGDRTPSDLGPALEDLPVDRPVGPLLAGPAPGRVVERGRAKAYRPLPEPVRLAALARGLSAYERGDFYHAHEELEPAWMGTDDPAERAFLGGLIKLAGAFVHAERGNPVGIRMNLVGARDRLADARDRLADASLDASIADRGPADLARAADLDLVALVAAVDDCLEAVRSYLALHGPAPTSRTAGEPVPAHDVVGPRTTVRGARVPIEAPALPRKRLG